MLIIRGYRKPRNNQTNINTQTDLPIAVRSPTIEENRMAIRQLKSGGEAEPDNISAESLKSDTEVISWVRHVLFRKI